jgi:hypothetical protein
MIFLWVEFCDGVEVGLNKKKERMIEMGKSIISFFFRATTPMVDLNSKSNWNIV